MYLEEGGKNIENEARGEEATGMCRLFKPLSSSESSFYSIKKTFIVSYAQIVCHLAKSVTNKYDCSDKTTEQIMQVQCSANGKTFRIS